MTAIITSNSLFANIDSISLFILIRYFPLSTFSVLFLHRKSELGINTVALGGRHSNAAARRTNMQSPSRSDQSASKSDQSPWSDQSTYNPSHHVTIDISDSYSNTLKQNESSSISVKRYPYFGSFEETSIELRDRDPFLISNKYARVHLKDDSIDSSSDILDLRYRSSSESHSISTEHQSPAVNLIKYPSIDKDFNNK